MNDRKTHFNAMLDGISGAYKKYNKHFEVFPEDNLIQKIGKYLGRVFVLFIMVLLSPVLFIGLSLALAAVF